MSKIYKAIILLFLIVLLKINASAEQPVTSSEIGIDERLGKHVPLDLSFSDEEGKPVTLRQLVNKPTIVSLVYYHCADICNPLLSEVVSVLDRLESEPGKDFSVLTISFDENDTPVVAAQKKNNYLTAFNKKKFPEKAWRFLTGDITNIRKFTNAVGFKFKREGAGFLHPASPLIVLSSDGKIIRYLYGIKFLPFDLKMAITEASEGRVGTTIGKALLFCYSYDPKGRKYALNILKIAGIIMLLFVITFFVYLTAKKKPGM